MKTDMHISGQNRKPRIKSTYLWSTDLQPRCQETQWRKDNLFSKSCWENLISTCRMKMDPYLTLSTKINLNTSLELNIGPETLKLLEKNIAEKLLDIVLGNILEMTQKAQATKTKDTWDASN